MADVQEINLIKLYQMAKEMVSINRLTTDMPANEAWFTLSTLHTWLESFSEETQELPMEKTHAALAVFHEQLAVVHNRCFADTMAGNDAPLTLNENLTVREVLQDFEKEFEHDSRSLFVLGVTPKGGNDLRMLVQKASTRFEARLLAVMPDKTKDDLDEAGRCLALERPTACAFHVCRATEGLMRAYYKHLTGDDWPPPPPKPPMRKDWAVLVDQLRVEGAPNRITNRLAELREDRNSYAHPDVSVPIEEAPVIYELCNGVIFYMAKEMI